LKEIRTSRSLARIMKHLAKRVTVYTLNDWETDDNIEAVKIAS
jgi:hypothetical protein